MKKTGHYPLSDNQSGISYFQRASGTAVEHVFSLFGICMLLLLVTGAAIRVMAGFAIRNSCEEIARKAVVMEDKESAEAMAAQEAADKLKGIPCIDEDSIQVTITYAPGCDTWQKGEFMYISESVDIKGPSPFSSGTYESPRLLKMIERNIDDPASDNFLNSVAAGAAQADTASEWLNVCATMAANMDAENFHYSNDDTKTTYASALSDGKRSNCALAVSWCLQAVGAVPSGGTFYYNGNFHTNGSWSWSGITKIEENKKCSSVDLKEGDIVCFKSFGGHVAIYAGINSSGKRTWYSFGKEGTTDSHNEGGSFRQNLVGPVLHEYYADGTVGYVLRIKNMGHSD